MECTHGSTGHQHRCSLFQSTKWFSDMSASWRQDLWSVFRTYRFTLEHVGWFPIQIARVVGKLQHRCVLLLGNWLSSSRFLYRCLLTNCNADPSNFSVKRKERLEIHLHKCSFETQMLRHAGASSFGIHKQGPLHRPRTNRSRVQTKSKVGNRRRPCHQQQWAIEGTEESKDTPKQYSVICLTWFWSSSKEKMPSTDITRSEGYWIFSKAEWVRIAGQRFKYPSHRDKKSWCFWGVLVRWNVGLRLETLRMPSYPCSPTSNSRACKQNHQSWMTHQTALQDAMQGNMKICLTVGLAWTYCSMQWMLLSSRLLRMFLLQSVHNRPEETLAKSLGESLRCFVPDCTNSPHFYTGWLAATLILNFSVKRKERLEIHLSNGTLTLRHAGASSFGIHAANRVLYTAPERTEAESKQSRRSSNNEP